MSSVDISHTIVAKSDQLNAEDLLGGPIVVQIEDVRVVQGDQPVHVHISGGHKPWKPCKTQRRLLARLMGSDASKWRGRWMRLHNDPTVLWAGKEVGGIRLQALSGLQSKQTVSLSVTRGKRKPHTVVPLDPPKTIEQALQDAGLTPADFDAWAAANGRPPIAQMDAHQKGNAARWLSSPQAVEAVRGAGGGE